jgi:hypothetical protein
MRSIVLAAVAVAAFASSAHASIIPVLDTVTPNGSNFTFTYNGGLAPDQGVTNGSQLAIVDFRGYVPGTVATSLSNVTASVVNTVPFPMLLQPGYTDDPTIPDLLFTYTGPDFQTSGGPFGGITYFTGLSADSTFGGTATGSFSAVAIKNVGDLAGTNTYNVGLVAVPSAVPEPATWAMMLTGFLGLGMALRNRRRKDVALPA